MEMKADFGQMEAGATQISGAARNINQQLEDLKRFLQPLVASWTGEAATGYQAKQAQWDRAAQDLNQILQQIGRAVGTSTENYQAAENANRNIWS